MTRVKVGPTDTTAEHVSAGNGSGITESPITSNNSECFETIDISRIELDEDIYPRTQKSQKTIEVYAEAMRSGALFPPIEVQRILDSGLERIVLIDGWHRVNAYQENKVREVQIRHWCPEVLDKKTHLKDLRVRCITANLTHGDRLTNRDKENMCQLMAEADDPKTITEEEFGAIFGIAQKTVNNWIGAIRARQNGSRNNLIYRLSFLGWTQQEIADKVRIDRSAVSKIVNSSNFTEIHNSLTSGRTISEVAEFHGLDLPVAWHIMLLGEPDDTARFERLERSVPLYDVWSFGARDNKYGIANYKWGLITGQIIENLLYLYTAPGELVLDPMAGGGTTNDVCLVLNRECASFDIDPVRDDIKYHDITTGVPSLRRAVRLAILEPPYFNMKQDAYSTLDEYYEFLRLAIRHSAQMLQAGGHLALIVMDQVNKNHEKFPIIGPSYAMLQQAGLEYEHLVSLPLGTEQFQAYHVARAKENHFMLGINRQMWIFRRPAA